VSDEPTINVVKIGGLQQVSFETLLRAGAITDEEARELGWEPVERAPVSRWRSLRWRMSAWWYDHRPRVHLGDCDHSDCSW
jgi:hypothetical protein